MTNKLSRLAALFAFAAALAIAPSPANPVAGGGEAADMIASRQAPAVHGDNAVKRALEIIQSSRNSSGRIQNSSGSLRSQRADKTLILGGAEAFPM